MPVRNYTAIVEREGDGFMSLCPELDVASQGRTVEEAVANLKEAVELFLECADASEVELRQGRKRGRDGNGDAGRKRGRTETGRVAQGDYSPRAPTDPDVRIARIWLVMS
jgi:predicted RNase H-like HicB family nuclease